MSGFALLSAIATLKLPETLNKQLPTSSAELIRSHERRASRGLTDDREPLLRDAWLNFVFQFNFQNYSESYFQNFCTNHFLQSQCFTEANKLYSSNFTFYLKSFTSTKKASKSGNLEKFCSSPKYDVFLLKWGIVELTDSRIEEVRGTPLE